MKTIVIRFSYALIVFFLILMNISYVAWAAEDRASTSGMPENSRQMTQEELQAAVISYANRYIAIVGQAAVRLEAAIPTDQARLNAARRKVYSITAVVETAAGPNPGPALLDLVVTATLNRMVWEEYWRPQIFGKPATIMVEAFKTMEVDAWELAAKVMTHEQRQEFRDLINDWYANHPEQVFVDYVTFSDFGDIGTKPNLKNIQKPGGLLAPIREATEAVDDVRMTVERAMFLLAKMQLIMGSQAELVYRNLIVQPEMKTMLTDISGLKQTADRYAVLLEKLPQQVSEERKAILDAIDDKAAAIHDVNTGVQATLRQADITLKSLQQTTVAASDLVASTDALLARFETGESAEPVTMADYIKAIETLQAVLSDFNQIILTVDQTGIPLISTVLDQFNRSAEERVDHIFWRLLILIVAAGCMGVVIIAVYNLSKRRSK
ncbi:hypothetical protein DSCW_22260 [Desulfosarcina widdelii]|uniref:Uncharacterized protein n=1 Tax=Desulfosarcina widdelii TaxID=947919 RepID=A0A5K7Z3H2_9BACT|nr:hypothetical protein [Desulfosarcina widdelii]BBO74809.1 hypothetical protein DSCW_22260 [Desulfosarcina widdelii]